MRPGWRWGALLIAIALVPTLIILLVEQNESGSTQPAVTTYPVIVATIGITSGATQRAGIPITASVTIRSDRRIPADDIVVAVRTLAGGSTDSSGRPLVLTPALGQLVHPITSKQQSYVMSGVIRQAGHYYYLLGYHALGKWHYLPPYYDLTVS